VSAAPPSALRGQIFQQRGDSLVARIRELSGRELSVGDLLSDV